MCTPEAEQFPSTINPSQPHLRSPFRCQGLQEDTAMGSLKNSFQSSRRASSHAETLVGEASTHTPCNQAPDVNSQDSNILSLFGNVPSDALRPIQIVSQAQKTAEAARSQPIPGSLEYGRQEKGLLLPKDGSKDDLNHQKIMSAGTAEPYHQSQGMHFAAPSAEEGLGTQTATSTSPAPYQSKYALRQNARNGKQTVTTWYDGDDSGNFDPNQERRRRKTESKEIQRRGILQHLPRYQVGGNSQRPKVFSLLQARQRGDSLIASFNIQSHKGKSLLSQYTDNWPAEYWNTFNEDHVRENLCARQYRSSFGPVLRPRKRYIRYGSLNGDNLPPIVDPLQEYEDLRGHPEARGCIRCRIQGEKCTLRDSGNTWPCRQCVNAFEGEQYVDCELIIRPSKKQACERCLEFEKDCSYSRNGDSHELPCEECLEEGVKCIAKPAPDAISKRITYTPPPGVEYIQYRPFVSCTACRQVKRSCSLKSKADKPPCKACMEANIPCTFGKVLSTNPGKRRVDESATGGENYKNHQQKQEETARKRRPLFDELYTGKTSSDTGPVKESVRLMDQHSTIYTESHALNDPKPLSPIIMMCDTQGHSGPLGVILTRLSHPVEFMHPSRCTWCHNPMYGICGLSWKKPTVIMWSNGLGYTEMHDGHRENGVEPDAMCNGCTMARVAIMSCVGHRMRALRPPFMSGDEVKADLEAAFQRLFAGTSSSTDHWCCLCPSPAVFECCAEQETDKWGMPVEPQSAAAVGCGLHLCDACEKNLRAAEGDLQFVLAEKLGTDRGLKDSRADASFLRFDGLLMKNVLAI